MVHTHNITGAAGPIGPIGMQGPVGAVGMKGGAGVPLSIGAGGVVTSIGYAGGAGGGGGVGGFQAPTISITTASNSIMLNNREVPEGEEFDKSLELYLVDMRLDGCEPNHFHYTVWTKLFGEIYSDYGVVVRKGHGAHPAFGSPQTREHFRHWLVTYEAKFFSKLRLSETVCPPPRSGDVKGVWIEDTPVDENSFDFRYVGTFAFLHDWTWIAGNCHGAVTRFSNGWLFELDTDAIHFKMR